jgi:hypothetical protein
LRIRHWLILPAVIDGVVGEGADGGKALVDGLGLDCGLWSRGRISPCKLEVFEVAIFEGARRLLTSS